MKINLLLLVFAGVSFCTLLYEYFAVEKFICGTYSCSSKVDNVLLSLLVLSILNIVFLITIKFCTKNAFTAWWKFAKYSIPTILLLSAVINLELHHSPAGQWQGVFDAPALVLLYLIFTIGSVIQIVRGHRHA